MSKTLDTNKRRGHAERFALKDIARDAIEGASDAQP